MAGIGMKYRIFERTVGGKVEYLAQVKRFGFWFYLLVDIRNITVDIFPHWYSFYGSKQSFIDDVENAIKYRYNRTPSKLVHEGEV